MYTKGEVIWAKIKGFPWWPGVIAKVIEDPDDPSSIYELLVNFIGENSHAQLNLDKVAKFQDKYNEFAKMKKKKLLEAIEIANKIVKGETTFKAESAKFDGKGQPTQTPKRKKDTKPNQKSPKNKEGESDGESASDDSSENEGDSPPQLTKTKSKQKTTENKPLKRQNSTPLEKTPASNKNGKSRVGDKREAEEHKDSDEPKLTKARKTNDDSELPEQINGKIERHISAPPLTHKSSHKEVVPVSDKGPLDFKDFDVIRNLIVERITIVSKNTPVSGTILEKSIENVISKINPDTVTVAEIIEKGIGKNIYTMIVLLDELMKYGPKTGMNIENEIDNLRNKLVIYNERIKSKLISQFVENNDACTPWLKKIDKLDKSSHKDIIQEIQKSKGKNNKLDKVNELAEEEESLEDKNSAPGLQMDFEEFRYEGDKKKGLTDKNKMVTTSTKVTKPIYNTGMDMKKNDNKQKENVMNPNLRKKICVKMSKIMQEKYGLTREAAQTLTLKVENRIRSVNSDMGSDYKNKILIVLKLLKFSKDEIEQYANDFSKGFDILEEKLDVYQQQNADLQLDVPFGDDSPPSTKEISREVSIINGKIC